MPTTTTTTTTTPRPTVITETALIGTGTNALANIEYSVDSSSVVYTEDLGSPVAAILYAEKTNKAYISTTNYLYEYAIGYYTGTKEYSQLLSVANGDGSIINTYRKDDNSLWAIQSYNGKVVKMNPSTLSVIKTFDGFDAPHKIRYSAFHNAYFVAGSNILWKIDDVNNTICKVSPILNDVLISADAEGGVHILDPVTCIGVLSIVLPLFHAVNDAVTPLSATI